MAMFDRVRRARPVSLPLPAILVGLSGWLLVRHLVAVPILSRVENVTRGLITSSFLLTLVAIAVLVTVIVLTGGIQPDDVGLHRDYLGRGVGVVAMIWGASQIIGVLPRVVANRPVLLDRQFEYGSGWEMGGQFLTALGNATLEEIAFRGFLLVQLYLLLNTGHRKTMEAGGWATAVTVVMAILATLPRILPYPSLELAAIDLSLHVAGGILLCWLYLRTRNLFFVIGIHALLVAPTPVVAGPGSGRVWYQPLVIAILATIWALLWPRRD